jgi:hypothetical protein
VPTVIITEHEPFPEESHFVAQNRAEIPARARVTTATQRGKHKGGATGTRRATASNTPAAASSTPVARGRGIRGRAARGRATQQNQEEGEPGTSHTTAARGRAKRNGTIGREEWLMFGDGDVNGSQQPDATVLQSTQEPPPV